MRDNYKKVEAPADKPVALCPVCGSVGELWRYSEADDAPTTTAVMCSNGDAFGPQSGVANEGCLLYMPPHDFYRASMRDAIRFWNEYATALSAQRRKRNWETAKVMRDGNSQTANGATQGNRTGSLRCQCRTEHGGLATTRSTK